MNPQAADRAAVAIWTHGNAADHWRGGVGVDLSRCARVGKAGQAARYRCARRVSPDARRYRAVTAPGVGARGGVAFRAAQEAKAAGQDRGRNR